jgi:transposase
VPAAHVQQGPGRKTDQADARWLAKRRRDGWLAARFIPPQGQRDLRDWTRDRTTRVHERSRAGNRVHGGLERATIQLAAVATDLRGVSGRAILAALMAGQAAPGTMAELAQGRRRAQLPRLEQALTGLMRDHHRRLLAWPWAPSDFWDEPIETLRVEITRRLGKLAAEGAPAPTLPGTTGEGSSTGHGDAPGPPMPLTQAIAVLDPIPGVDQRGAERLVAEWGTDMSRVGTASRLSAWMGVAPGHDERAGKPRAGTTRQGHRTLRTGLTPLAHAAARTTGTDLSALSQRLATRRGSKRALMAVAPAIVVSAFPRLSRHEPYRERGATYVDEQRRDPLVDHLTRRIQRLGSHVHLDPVQTTEH